MIEELIRDHMAQKSRLSSDDSPSLAGSKKMTRSELSEKMLTGSKESSKLTYVDFKKIILDSTLGEHENQHGRFTELFKSVDRD